ncbi:MAG: hypothetical protein REH79_02260 [Spiroplasma sp.]|nr:hypothetical protein [Spiroplasma sp.]
MQKILQLLLTLTLTSVISLPISGCAGFWFGGNSENPKQPKPIEEDIAYYQALITINETYIKECQEWINDIEKEIETGEVNQDEAKIEITAISAEVQVYQGKINEYQYQILLLQSGGKITIVEKGQAIIFLTAKIENLREQLRLIKILQAEFPEDYPDQELKTIEKNITDTEIILKEILEIEEKKNDQSNFKQINNICW